MNPLQILILIIAVGNIALADICIMKAARTERLVVALYSPWMAGAVALYLSQIVALTYFFVKGWEFGATSLLQLVIYAVIVVIAAVVVFGESITPVRLLGIGLAVTGIAIVHSH